MLAGERQQWVLAELANDRKLRRADLEKRFGISTATAKRDLGDLTTQIEFVGTGAAGYYVPARRGSVCPFADISRPCRNRTEAVIGT